MKGASDLMGKNGGEFWGLSRIYTDDIHYNVWLVRK